MAGIILFDGVCNFCSRSVRFVLKRDNGGYFKFASLQGETAKELLNRYGQYHREPGQVHLRHPRHSHLQHPHHPDHPAHPSHYPYPVQPDSFILIEDGRLYMKSTAALRVCGHLPGAWKLLSMLRIIPRPVRDLVYDLVAQNRFKWFGRNDSCLLPSPEERNRFLD
jgi:predicted DCC family thiol-disulfide oxidoreductase YuxK